MESSLGTQILCNKFIFYILLNATQTFFKFERKDIGFALPQPEFDLILDVLKQGHERAVDKIGTGVEKIKIGNNPKFPQSRCFIIIRKDQTEEDFSFRKVHPSKFKQSLIQSTGEDVPLCNNTQLRL